MDQGVPLCARASADIRPRAEVNKAAVSRRRHNRICAPSRGTVVPSKSLQEIYHEVETADRVRVYMCVIRNKYDFFRKFTCRLAFVFHICTCIYIESF